MNSLNRSNVLCPYTTDFERISYQEPSLDTVSFKVRTSRSMFLSSNSCDFCSCPDTLIRLNPQQEPNSIRTKAKHTPTVIPTTSGPVNPDLLLVFPPSREGSSVAVESGPGWVVDCEVGDSCTKRVVPEAEGRLGLQLSGMLTLKYVELTFDSL